MALVRADVTVTLVADLVHLAPETVQATVLAALAPGSAADVVVLDDDLTVDRTVVGGSEVHAR